MTLILKMHQVGKWHHVASFQLMKDRALKVNAYKRLTWNHDVMA